MSRNSEIFDINKSFPSNIGDDFSFVIVNFDSEYDIFLQASLEPQFLLLETEFLARFKRVMYNGAIAPIDQLRVFRFKSSILPCIDLKDNSLFLLDKDRNLKITFSGNYLEELVYKDFDVSYFIDTENINFISREVFAKEVVEYYRLENLYDTKLMKIYGSQYFVDNFIAKTEYETGGFYSESTIEVDFYD